MRPLTDTCRQLRSSIRKQICARRNAMDNASKNAGEMIDSEWEQILPKNSFNVSFVDAFTGLQMQFNRQRQAVITNELVDIIVRRISIYLGMSSAG